MLNDTAALIDRSVETTASVIGRHYDNFYYPIVEFKDRTGSTVSAQSIDASAFYYGTEKVPILCDPVNP